MKSVRLMGAALYSLVCSLHWLTALASFHVCKFTCRLFIMAVREDLVWMEGDLGSMFPVLSIDWSLALA